MQSNINDSFNSPSIGSQHGISPIFISVQCTKQGDAVGYSTEPKIYNDQLYARSETTYITSIFKNNVKQITLTDKHDGSIVFEGKPMQTNSQGF